MDFPIYKKGTHTKFLHKILSVPKEMSKAEFNVKKIVKIIYSKDCLS